MNENSPTARIVFLLSIIALVFVFVHGSCSWTAVLRCFLGVRYDVESRTQDLEDAHLFFFAMSLFDIFCFAS
jgi:hypothetical protein